MRRFPVVLLAVVLVAACADGSPPAGTGGGDGAAGDAYPWELPTEDATVEAARQRAEDMVRGTAGHLGLALDDGDWVDPDEPRVTACDEGAISAETPFTANVRARVGGAVDADDLLAEVGRYWRSRGVDGIAEQFAESTTPSLNGTFDDQRWQVSVLVNTDHDFVSLVVNTPCLPSEEWDQR
jgi:hypothetical protein